MSYNAPIGLFVSQLRLEQEKQLEDDIFRAVQEIGITVDKDELIKALKYDRYQYVRGYTDGLIADKWTPAYESLPQDGETVLVWFEYFRYGDYNRPFQMYGLSHTFRGEWSGIVNDTTGWKDLKIIAWQPLPAPPQYKGVKI